MKIVVYHGYMGCDTGCCGHMVETGDAPHPRFHISHPWRGDDHLTFAQDLVREEFGDEHVADLDWENCYISED